MVTLPYNSSCTKCPLHVGVKSVCIPGEGNLNAKVLFITTSPGADDDLTGTLLNGSPGKLLKAALEETGITSYRVETIVRCRPPDNREPTKEEINVCKSYLDNVIQNHLNSLSIVVPLGEISLKLFGLKGAITNLAGSPVQLNYAGKALTVFPVTHPSYVLRNQSYLSTWESHFHILRNLIDPSLNEKSISMTSFDDMILETNDLPNTDPIAIDLETTGLDSKRDSILSYSMSTPSSTHYVKLNEPKDLSDLIKRLNIGMFVTQGAFFEGSWFRNLFNFRKTKDGLPLISRDTMLMAYRVDPGQPMDLGSIAARYVPQFAGYKLATQDEMERPYTIADEDLKQRNIIDSKVTAIACVELEKRMPPGVTPELLQEDVDLALTVQEISEKGLLLDEEELIRQRVYAEDKQAIASAGASKLLNTDINLGSPSQVGTSLVSLGATLGQTTSRNYSTGEVELRTLREYSQNVKVNELVDHVLSYREAGKLLGTYISGYAQRIDGDKRLRTRLRFPGTISWRLSSSDPNLQNVPRGKFRSAFIAPPGMVLLECDLAQAELRVMAALSKDSVLFPLFMNGGDPHNLMVQQIGKSQPTFLNLPPTEQRNRAKVTNFGLGYGAGPGTLWEQFAKDGVFLDMAECRLYHRTFWQTYKDFGKFVDNQMDTARNGGRLYAPTGGYSWSLNDLKLIHVNDEQEALRACFNCTIQSVPPRITLRLAKRLLELNIEVVLQTHDGLLLYVPSGSEQEVAKVVKDIVRELTSEAWLQGLPMPVDVKSGPNWGALTKL